MEQAKPEPVDIKYWDPNIKDPAYKKALLDIIDSFSGPENLKVTFLDSDDPIGTSDDWWLAPNAPDVLLLKPYPIMQYFDQKRLLDLTTRVTDLEDYRPELLQYSNFQPPDEEKKSERAIFSLPQTGTPLVLMYNKRIIEESGLDPNSPPGSVDALMNYAQKIVDGGKYAGFLLSDGYDILPFLYAFGGGLYDTEKKDFILASDADIHAMQFAVALNNISQNDKQESIFQEFREFYTTLTGQGPLDFFKQGKVGMIFGEPTQIPGILASDAFHQTGGESNLGITLLPAGPNGHMASPFNVMSYVINAKTQHPEEAFHFVECLNSPENQETLAIRLNILPSRISPFEKGNLPNNIFMPILQTQLGRLSDDDIFILVPDYHDPYMAGCRRILAGAEIVKELSQTEATWRGTQFFMGYCCAVSWLQFCCPRPATN